MEKRIPLTEMEANETGKVIEMHGGHGMVGNLEKMGIRIGTEIKKKNQQLMRGPMMVQVGNTQVAIGYGMAKRIIIEVKK